jgi:hypothetical protein
MNEEELGEKEELTELRTTAAKQLQARSEGADLPEQCTVEEGERRRHGR